LDDPAAKELREILSETHGAVVERKEKNDYVAY
jgi:trehalose-6-phosphatase